MKVTVNRMPAAQHRETAQPPTHNPPFDRQAGMWGRVDALNSNDNTVDVVLDTGVFLSHVPVASPEWVIYGDEAGKEFNSGGRNLPPVRARVFVFMPNFTFNDCFTAPFSGFNNPDKNTSKPFLEDGRQKIKERITPSGWHITDDYVTGSHKSASPDGKTILEIDYGGEEEPKKDNPELHLNIFGELTIEHVKNDFCTIKVFDTEIVIKEGAVSLKPKETKINIDGNAAVEAAGDISVKGQNINVEALANAVIKAVNAQITGGNLQVNGAASPGAGPFNCLPSCVFSGVMHTGNTVSNT